MTLKQDDVEKPSVCPPHVAAILEEKNRDQEIAEAEQRVHESEGALNETTQKHTNAQNALNKPPKGARMSELRRQVEITAKAIPGAEKHLEKQREGLKSRNWEKKVADDMGGGKTYRILCAICKKEELGDFDVVTADRVKEVKSSAGGYNETQFNKYRELVEGLELLGPGMTMKLAVPAADQIQVENDNPTLKDRVQGH